VMRRHELLLRRTTWMLLPRRSQYT
jgi:hypothetical protein